jgi:hypothetical protein
VEKMAHVLQEVVILQGVRGESEKFFFNGLQLNKSCNLSKARSVFLVLECKDISRGRCPYKLYVRRCPASPVHIIKFPANSNSIFNLNYKIPCNYMNNNTIFLLIITQDISIYEEVGDHIHRVEPIDIQPIVFRTQLNRAVEEQQQVSLETLYNEIRAQLRYLPNLHIIT